MITAALNGELENINYKTHPIFGIDMPTKCPNVPEEVLNPKNTWNDRNAYESKANKLAEAFNKNFKNYADQANEEILNAAPRPSVNV